MDHQRLNIHGWLCTLEQLLYLMAFGWIFQEVGAVRLCGPHACQTLPDCTVSQDWAFRALSPLEIAARDSPTFETPLWNFSIDFRTIHNMTIAPGHSAELCEPDFTDSYPSPTCLHKTIVSLNCNARTNAATCELVAPSRRYQLFRLSFLENWGCFQQSDIPAGDAHRKALSSTQQPNYMTVCTDVEVIHELKCVHACQVTTPFVEFDELAPACTEFQYHLPTTARCAGLEQPLYKCLECGMVNGSATTAYEHRADQTQCAYTQCNAGTHSINSHTCSQCAKHYVSGAGATECQQCELGQTSNTANTACIDCFTDFQSGAECRNGSFSTLDISEMMTFYGTLHTPLGLTQEEKNGIIRDACVDTYGCIPCSPGFFLDAATNSCTACPHGMFQPNYGRTSCYSCHETESTLSTGSTSNADCLCVEGFEQVPET